MPVLILRIFQKLMNVLRWFSQVLISIEHQRIVCTMPFRHLQRIVSGCGKVIYPVKVIQMNLIRDGARNLTGIISRASIHYNNLVHIWSSSPKALLNAA